MLLQITDPLDKKNSIHNSIDYYAVGIDFGTTNTVVSMVDEINKNSHVIITEEGSMFMPSFICEGKGELLFGHEAIAYCTKYQQSSDQPIESIYSIKRKLDQPLRFVFKNIRIIDAVQGFFSYLKKRLDHHFNISTGRIVVTVPAHFDDTARQSIRDAATLAGFDVMRVLNEPTAAALAYHLDENIEGLYAIYDFGGGTFDLSILEMTKGIFRVIATSGDIHLGGDDIDEAIAAHWYSKQKNTDFFSLLPIARKAKEALFLDQDSTSFSFDGFELSQQEAISIATPFIQKTLDLCQKAIDDLPQYNKKDSPLKGVILVGGSSRSWLVQKKVHEFFGLNPLVSIYPEQVVSFGAAVQAYHLTAGSRDGTLLVDVAPLSLGIETYGGLVEKIIHRNTPIPVQVTQDFTTFVDGQTSMDIHVVQGERELVHDCRSLGRFTLSNIPPMNAGNARIRVKFSLDSDGILEVEAKEISMNVRQSISIKPSYGLSREDMHQMLVSSYESAGIDMQQRMFQQTIVEAKQLVQYVEQALADDEDLLDPQNAHEIKNACTHLDHSIKQKDDVDKIKDYIKHLSNITQDFAQKRIVKAIKGSMVNEY
jgi:molecular chaperone HscA